MPWLLLHALIYYHQLTSSDSSCTAGGLVAGIAPSSCIVRSSPKKVLAAFEVVRPKAGTVAAEAAEAVAPAPTRSTSSPWSLPFVDQPSVSLLPVLVFTLLPWPVCFCICFWGFSCHHAVVCTYGTAVGGGQDKGPRVSLRDDVQALSRGLVGFSSVQSMSGKSIQPALAHAGKETQSCIIGRRQGKRTSVFHPLCLDCLNRLAPAHHVAAQESQSVEAA